MVYLRTLGECVIEVGGARIEPSAPQMFAALLYASLESGRRIPRARLQELLVPTAEERAGAHALRQLLYRIRRLAPALSCDAASVLLPRECVTADFHQFLRPAHHPAGELARLSGGFLPGFAPTFSRPFADWLEQRREEVLWKIRRTLAAELVEHRGGARWPEAEQTARALLALDPLNEEATLALAEVAALSGSKVEAVRLLDTYLEEVGPRERVLRVPAAVLRKRIAERLPDGLHGGGIGLVGRSQPLAVLGGLLTRGRVGEAAACYVWGEAGIGKTRLVTEFARAAVLDGARVEFVRSQPHDVRRPMGAFTDLVPALLRLPGALGCSPEAVAFLRKLFTYEGGSASLPSADVREAELLSANISRAISELLDAVTSESTIVLVVEDAQWADPISLRVFADLIAERKERPLVVVLTSRESWPKALVSSARPLTSLRLNPLSESESDTLLKELFSQRGVDADAELLRWCRGVASGNPFFLHSVAVHWVATGEGRRVPEPLNALLCERLRVLDDRARHVFEACAVLGRHATLENVAAVLGIPGYELLTALYSLEELAFVKWDGQRVESAHALLSELALERMPASVRALLHQAAARRLHEMAMNSGYATVLWDCAEHWLHAGDRAQSIAVLRACGRHALQIGQPSDAVDALRRAADLAAGAEEHVDALRELLTAAEIAGSWPTVLEALASIRRESRLDGPSPSLTPAEELLEIDAALSCSANPEDFVDRLRRYSRDASVGPIHRLRACVELTCAAESLLRPELAHEAYAVRRTIDEAVDDPATLMFDVIYHASFANVDQAIEPARRLIARAASETNLAGQIRMRLCGGVGLLRAGRLEEGCAAQKDAYEVAVTCRLLTGVQRAATHLASIMRELGPLEEARAWHDKASRAMEQLNGRAVAGVDFLSNCVLFAMDDRHYRAAEQWVRKGLELPRARVGNARLHFRALALRIKQAAHGYDCPRAELDDLLHTYVRCRSVGCHDDVVEALWHALEKKGRGTEADGLVREYITHHRRHRLPLAPGLATLVAQLSDLAREPLDRGGVEPASTLDQRRAGRNRSSGRG